MFVFVFVFFKTNSIKKKLLSQFGKCKPDHPPASKIADYNLANDTRDVFFHFFKCEKILEIIDKNYKEIVCALHNRHSTVVAGMFVLTLST